MESTLLSLNSLYLSKSFVSHSTPLTHRHFFPNRSSELAHLQFRCSEFGRICSGPAVRGVGIVDPRWTKLQCAASSASSFTSDGGGSDGIEGNVGGCDSDGSQKGSEGKSTEVSPGDDDASAVNLDVIVLHVGGMTCGGCSASVKKILESQTQVSSANVDLTTETAMIWPVSEAKAAHNWRKDLGEVLAKHLTSCGFKSNLRDRGAVEGKISS
ncbi:copper-transporting ATPase PAA1, chloroplastic-like isoform X2 [Olea europaea subsp. europaea]|uniref:Copper-transporting ATPase PAA1, chloroplastic-like isoform X2 n=1 Tax=Olea europaea subsp. europaea TaxID=158383 RepID=A0A8S0QV35_OLEEU|nr:copper-transporting ATPase PAA1, chloroplastic-like isoform X2 [Olea europaea subsp. europaea]